MPLPSCLKDLPGLGNRASLVFFDPGGLTKCDRKKERTDNTGENQNVSNTFHGFVLLNLQSVPPL